MPRLLFVATSRNDGGVERHAVHMAAGLKQRGADICFACLPGEIVARHCAAQGIDALPLAVRNSADLRAVWQVARLLIAGRIDLVHVHSRRDYLPVLLGVALAKARGHRTRLLLHAHMVRSLGDMRWLSGRVFRKMTDGVVAVSESVRAHVLAAHGLTPGFVRVIPNGIELERFAMPGTPQARAWRTEFRREWDIPAHAPVVTMVGRLDAKGQAFLLSAAPRLVRQFPAMRFVLVGTDGVPGTAAHLRAQTDALGLSGHVIFTGSREDIPAVLAASDALAHLPTDEAFGLALAEAMAAGLPTVATSIGGCREVVQEGVTGILVPPGDDASLAGAITQLFEADGPRLRAQYGAAGRARAAQEYSFAGQIDRLEQLYHALCPFPR